MRQSPFATNKIVVFLSLLALTALISPARGSSLVANGSFELTTATTTSQFLSVSVFGWSNSDIGEAIVLPSWFTNGYLFPPNVGFAGPVPQSSPDGGNFVYSDGDYHNSAIQQTINGLNPGDSYELSFYQGLAEDTEPNVTIPGPVSGRWQVSLGASTQFSTMMFGNGTTNTISPWAVQTMTFTATNATEILSFLSIGNGDPPLVLLDGITLDATAPEPATIWLTGIGAAVLVWKLVARRKALTARQR